MGVGKIEWALASVAYSRTDRSNAAFVSTSTEEARRRNGLSVEADKIAGGSDPPDRLLAAVKAS